METHRTYGTLDLSKYALYGIVASVLGSVPFGVARFLNVQDFWIAALAGLATLLITLTLALSGFEWVRYTLGRDGLRIDRRPLTPLSFLARREVTTLTWNKVAKVTGDIPERPKTKRKPHVAGITVHAQNGDAFRMGCAVGSPKYVCELLPFVEAMRSLLRVEIPRLPQSA